MFVVTVEFVDDTAHPESFRTALPDSARASREPGCRQFDVCAAQNTTVILYEVYDDRVAFDAHVASAHVRAFDERVRDRLARRTVRTGGRIEP